MKKIKAGIIGRNFGYKVIFQALKKIRDFKIIGFSVKNKKKINLPENIKIYKNWKSLVSDKKIDAIFISSPPQTHKKIIEFSLKKNKHIFCDKPVTTSLKDVTKICNLLKKKELIDFVNYEFINIEAFQVFKRKYLTKLKISKVNVNWSIKVPTIGRSFWKNNHKMGGGNFYNYICHVLFYLENFFGKITINDSKLKDRNRKFELNTKFITENKKIKINLNFKTMSKDSKLKPVHKIIFYSNKGKFILFTKINSLYDQFCLFKNKKIIFKPKEIDYDFRLKPTYNNLVSFKNSIVNRNNGRPNFENALRIHFLINEIINFKNK